MDFKLKLKRESEKINLCIDDDQLTKFELFYNELVEYNKKVNLTAITDCEDFINKHIIDSLIPLGFINGFVNILDVGSGAGFPAIPLKIMSNTLNVVCLDSINKKVKWLDYIGNKLLLSNFKAVHARCEDLAFSPLFRDNFDCVVSRGVANLSTLIEYCVPFVKCGGYFVAYKASGYKEELDNAQKAIKLLDIHLEKIISFNNESLGERNVLVFKKLNKTNIKYPRKQNKPRLNPL